MKTAQDPTKIRNIDITAHVDQAVDQRRLAMINMSDDSDISNLSRVLGCFHKFLAN